MTTEPARAASEASGWALLEAIAADSRDDIADWYRNAAEQSSSVPWGYLIEQGVRQKILPLFALSALSQRELKVPLTISKHLRTSLELNRYRLRRLRQAAEEVQQAFDSAGIRSCVTKGLALEQVFYPGGTRVMNDVDFMVQPSDVSAAERVLSGLGYLAGEINFDTGRVEPHPRREEVFYRLNPDHLPVMTRATGDPLVPTVRIDVAYNMTWYGSEWEFGPADAIAQRCEVVSDDARLFAMTPAYRFVHTAIHLFREAWLSRWLESGQDVNLAKFSDILRIWAAEGDEIRDEVAVICAAHGVESLIAFVAAHTDSVFGTALAEGLGLQAVDSSFLASGLDTRANLRHWSGDMRERLQMPDRTRLFADGRTAQGHASG